MSADDNDFSLDSASLAKRDIVAKNDESSYCNILQLARV